MKLKHLLSSILFLLAISCCPTKSYFIPEFSELNREHDSIIVKLDSITLERYYQSNFSELNSNQEFILEYLDSIQYSINRIKPIECDTNTGYGKIINMPLNRNSSLLGLIEFHESDGELVPFKMNQANSVWLYDQVNFEVCKENGIYLAKNIKLANQTINNIDKKYSFDEHNAYWHKKLPQHIKGHILGRTIIPTNFRNRVFVPGQFEEMNISAAGDTTFNAVEEIYIPMEFQFNPETIYYLSFFKENSTSDFYLLGEPGNKVAVEILSSHPPH